MPHVEFGPVAWTELEPWRAQAKREHSSIDPLPSIRWFAASLATARLGCIGLLHVSSEAVRVRGWYVRPEYRGYGVGIFLQESAEDWARAHDYTRIESTTRLWRVLERRGWHVLQEYGPAIGTKMGLSLVPRGLQATGDDQ